MVKGLFRYAAAIAAAAFIVSCGQSDGVKVTVTNGSELARSAETVELDFGAIKAGHPEITAENVVVTDAAGAQVPSQVYVESYGQEKLVFQATVDAGKTVKYTVKVEGIQRRSVLTDEELAEKARVKSLEEFRDMLRKAMEIKRT